MHRVVGNHFVDAAQYLPFDPKEAGVQENVLYPVLMEILGACGEDEKLLRETVHARAHDLVPKHIITEDIVASISYLLGLPWGLGCTDDIDHLGNRRLRSVGELLQNQIRIGLSRLERVVRERMAIQDADEVRPGELINIRPVSAAIKEFFGSSQLSQFMDQTKPAGRAHPQAPPQRPGPRRPQPRPRLLRGARRALQPLRPHLPHRDA